MAQRSKILRHLRKLENYKSPQEFQAADPYVAAGNPTENLSRKGCGVGFLRLRPRTCDKLVEHIIQIVESKDYTTSADRLRRPESRLDVELPPRGFCWKVLCRILRAWKADKSSPWHRFKVRGVEPRVAEFSVLGSIPGSKNQGWHKDHYGGFQKLVSFGIPLIDVCDEHGPTECIPKGLNGNKYKRKPFRLRCRRGEMYAWDGGMTHRGTRNCSKIVRPIFMFSLCFSEKLPTKTEDLSLHTELLSRIWNVE